jgi:hypothetical protein
MIFDEDAKVELGDKVFFAGRLQVLMKTMELLGVQEVDMRYNAGKIWEKAIFHFSPEIDVLLMPVVKYGNE